MEAFWIRAQGDVAAFGLFLLFRFPVDLCPCTTGHPFAGKVLSNSVPANRIKPGGVLPGIPWILRMHREQRHEFSDRTPPLRTAGQDDVSSQSPPKYIYINIYKFWLNCPCVRLSSFCLPPALASGTRARCRLSMFSGRPPGSSSRSPGSGLLIGIMVVLCVMLPILQHSDSDDINKVANYIHAVNAQRLVHVSPAAALAMGPEFFNTNYHNDLSVVPISMDSDPKVPPDEQSGLVHGASKSTSVEWANIYESGRWASVRGMTPAPSLGKELEEKKKMGNGVLAWDSANSNIVDASPTAGNGVLPGNVCPVLERPCKFELLLQ